MTITPETIAARAPDQTSLAAASKLTKPGKWPLRAQDAESGPVWGECPSSGAAPYRYRLGAWRSRLQMQLPAAEIPRKHVLALTSMHAPEPAAFPAASPPDWLEDWRRRRYYRPTGRRPRLNRFWPRHS